MNIGKLKKRSGVGKSEESELALGNGWPPKLIEILVCPFAIVRTVTDFKDLTKIHIILSLTSNSQPYRWIATKRIVPLRERECAERAYLSIGVPKSPIHLTHLVLITKMLLILS